MDDQYVANALKSDAEKASDQYSSRGLSAYMPKRSTGAAPKPNTRFLRNIIRETDSHNAALLAKERREAREKERQRTRHSSPDKRKHGRLSPYNDDERPRKRRRSLERYPQGHGHGRGSSRDSDRRDEYHRSRRHVGSSTPRSRHPRTKDVKIDGRRKSSSSPERSSPGSSRPRAGRRGYRDSGHDRDGRGDTKDVSPLDGASSPSAGRVNAESDSDPLEAIVGPPPPPPEDLATRVRRRGRGAMSSNRAAMDEHFDTSYDPKIDVQPDPETEDDWDQALEALRDRQRWKQQGADRLKAAGFTEEVVKKWAKGDGKDDSDVRWTKKGEDREWDRGKVLEEDAVDLEPSWGRLKDQ